MKRILLLDFPEFGDVPEYIVLDIHVSVSSHHLELVVSLHMIDETGIDFYFSIENKVFHHWTGGFICLELTIVVPFDSVAGYGSILENVGFELLVVSDRSPSQTQFSTGIGS